MNNVTPLKHTALLRWIFRLGKERLICQVDEEFTVSLMSPGKAVRTFVEKCDDGLQAFQRHAQIASQLRDFGWTIASYGRSS